MLPVACVGCQVAGWLLCPSCRSELDAVDPVHRMLARPDAADSLPLFSGSDYRAAVRACVLAFKRTGSAKLGGVLVPLAASAVSVAAQLGDHHPADGPVLVVPMPSGSETRRHAGFDVPEYLARHACRQLRSRGVNVGLVQLFRPRDKASVQKGMSAPERFRNAAHRVHPEPGRIERLKRRWGDCAQVILFDDVATTGATLLAGRDSLARAGVVVAAAATVTTVATGAMSRAITGSDQRIG